MANNKRFIVLQNVAKRYGEGSLAVEKINLSIEKGSFVTLLGPSGCGKTTILKMLGGFETTTSGRILVNGIDTKNLAVNERETATVFQDYALFPNMNVYKNITYGLKVVRVPLDGTPAKVKREAIKVYENAKKEAEKKIIGLRKDLVKIQIQIDKTHELYRKYPQSYAIRKMRWSIYKLRLSKLFEKGSKDDKKFIKRLSLKNKIVEVSNAWDNYVGLDKARKPAAFSTKGLSKTTIEYLELRKWYQYNIPINKKFDKEVNHYNEVDHEISYWQNYPMIQKQKFENKNTNRLLTNDEIKAAAKSIIEKVGLVGNENKYPSELSGGMQQRVALARALVIKPSILLLDEPLSALDAKVRKQMQYELKRLHREFKLTFILVTHDQEEALSLSDKVVVMSKGKIQQVGSPWEIYDTPANEWVASFIGKANFFTGKYISEKEMLFNGKKIGMVNKSPIAVQPNDEVKFIIRPEDFDEVAASKALLSAKVSSVTYKGLMYEIECETKDKAIFTMETINKKEIGDSIYVSWTPADLHIVSNVNSKKEVVA